MEDYFQQSFSGETFSENEDKKFEFIRLGTFSEWPQACPVYSTKLAHAGFYYEGNIDEVTCYLCGVKKSNWAETDDPFIIHKQLSPCCRFFLSHSNNIAIDRDSINSPSDIIHRLESLELIDTGSAEAAPGSVGHQPNVSDSGGENFLFPKSRSDDQINKGKGADLPRSTSFPSSSTSYPVNSNLADSVQGPGSPRSESSSSTALSGKAGSPGLSTGNNSSINIGLKSFDLNKLKYEKNRLDTFKKWPRTVMVPPARLAKSGFFFTGIADRVMCVFCKGALRNWDEGDRPNFEHRKHFPKCRMVLGLEVGNVPLATVPKTPEQLRREQLSKDVAIAIDTTKFGDLGIITEKPKHPRYSIYGERLSTFRGWPPSKTQTPESLAEAGFFYAGFGDNVKCFYCNGGLRNWEVGDRPWIEHTKWFKKCPFIKQVKGEPFILQVLQEQKIEDTPILSQFNPPEASGGVSSITGQELPRRNALQSDLLGLQRVEEREIRARMDSAMARMVEAMGISPESIARAIRKRLIDEGDDFASARELVEAVFKLEEESPEDHEREVQDNNEDQTGDLDDQEHAAVLEPHPDNVNDSDVSHNTDEDTDKDKISDEAKSYNGKQEKNDVSEMGEAKKSLDDLEKENIDLKEQRLCKICMVADSSIVFLPCGHLVSCAGCSPALDNCPICREPIQGFVRTFIA